MLTETLLRLFRSPRILESEWVTLLHDNLLRFCIARGKTRRWYLYKYHVADSKVDPYGSSYLEFSPQGK